MSVAISSIAKWLVPKGKSRSAKKTRMEIYKKKWEDFTKHFQNEHQYYAFLFFIFAANVVLFITRAHQFRSFSMLNGFVPNGFSLFSRGCGQLQESLNKRKKNNSNIGKFQDDA